jgi:hypothetical protein
MTTTRVRPCRRQTSRREYGDFDPDRTFGGSERSERVSEAEPGLSPWMARLLSALVRMTRIERQRRRSERAQGRLTACRQATVSRGRKGVR